MKFVIKIYFENSINNRLQSIEDVMERAETYNLQGKTKKNYESALNMKIHEAAMRECRSI